MPTAVRTPDHADRLDRAHAAVHTPTRQEHAMPSPAEPETEIDPLVAPRAPDRPPSPRRPEAPAVAPSDAGDDESVSPTSRAPVARCADGNGTLTALFFSDNVHDIARAKAMCGLCPLRESCLRGALEREEPWGVWGGELLSGGRIIANKRPCGRPPKRPRPELVYDEMGPVGVVA
jgi:WhiB family redox-sensing transcriptional regulator